MLDFRLQALKRWQAMEEPWWRFVDYPQIDYQDIRYYSAPKQIAPIRTARARSRWMTSTRR